MVDAREQRIHNHPIYLLWGVVSTVILAGMIYFFLLYSVKTEISCERIDKNQGNCTFVEDHLLWKNKITLNLDQIKEIKASIVESPDDDNVEISVLTTEKERPEIKLLNAPSLNISEGKFAISNQLNTFLKDTSQKNFIKSYDNTKAPYICAGILALITIWGGLYYAYVIMKKL